MTAATAVWLAVAALQGNPDSVLAVYRRQVALEQAAWGRGQACVSDTTRLFREFGRKPDQAAEAWVNRFRMEGDMRRVAYEACYGTLTGTTMAYAPPPMPAAAARALVPKRPVPFSDGPFHTYTWVFYADLALGTLLGVIGALVLGRNATGGGRVAMATAGGILGAIGGGAIFLPFMFLTALFAFLSPPEPSQLFGITALVIVVGFVGAVMGSWAQKFRARSGMAEFKRSLGLKDR